MNGPFDRHLETRPYEQARADYRAQQKRTETIVFSALIAGIVAAFASIGYSLAVMRGYL